MKRDGKTLIREMGAITLANYLVQAINLLRGLFVAYYLGPAVYGIWNLFKSVLHLAPVAGAGSGFAMSLEMPFNKGQNRNEDNRALVYNALLLHIGMALIIASVTMLVVGVKADGQYRLEICLGGLAFVFQVLFFFVRDQLRGESNFFRWSRFLLLNGVVNAGLGVVLMIYFGIAGLLVATIIANGLVLLAQLYSGQMVLRATIQPQVMRKLIGDGFPLLVVIVGPRLMGLVERVAIFTAVGVAATGFYSLAAFFSMALSLITESISAVLAPKLMYEKGRKNDVTSIGLLYDKPILLISHTIPIFLVLIALNLGPAIHLVLPEYEPALPILNVMVLGLYFSSLIMVPRGALVVLNEQHIFLKAVPILLAIGCISVLATVRYGYGALGVAYASTTFYFFVSVIINIYTLRLLNKSRAEQITSMAYAYCPFFYCLGAFAMTHTIVSMENSLMEAAIRSLVFILASAPLIIILEVKLSIGRAVRSALGRS